MPDGQKVVQVPNLGNIAFPGTMDDASIWKAINDHVSTASAPGAFQTKPGGPILNANTGPEGTTPSDVARSGAGGFTGAILPEDQQSTDWKKNLSTIGSGLNQQVNKAATTSWGQGGPIWGVLSMLGNGLRSSVEGAATGAEEMGKGAWNKDPNMAAHGGGSFLGNLMTAGLMKKAPEAIANPLDIEGVRNMGQEVMGEGASKQRVLSSMNDRSMNVQKHIAGVADAVHNDAQAAMADVASRVDQAKPDGAFDKQDIGTRVQKAVGDLAEAKELPKAIRDLMPTQDAGQGTGPVVGGKSLDLKNPTDLKAYQQLKAGGAFTPEEIAKFEGTSAGGNMSFTDLQQARSAVGRALQGLEGAPLAAGNAVYGELSKALREGATHAGAEPDWIDANAKYKGYIDDFVRSPLKKTLFGDNAHEIMSPLASDNTRVQVADILSKYEPFGMNTQALGEEAKNFNIGQTINSVSRPSKMTLLAAALSPKAFAAKNVLTRALRNPSFINNLAGEGLGDAPTITPGKVYPSKVAAAQALKGNKTPFGSTP